MQKFLVTGEAGRIGNENTKNLVDDNVHVVSQVLNENSLIISKSTVK